MVDREAWPNPALEYLPSHCVLPLTLSVEYSTQQHPQTSVRRVQEMADAIDRQGAVTAVHFG